MKERNIAVARRPGDEEILSGIRSGLGLDDSIRAIYQAYFEMLSRYVLFNKGNQEDAEDIFQEVVVAFVELVQKDRFRGESSIGTFLYSMNRHAWLNEMKKRGRALARDVKFEKGREAMDQDAERIMADRENKALLVQLVNALGENCRKILLLYYYEEKSMKEILPYTGYENEQVVRNKKTKCLQQLEQMIGSRPSLKETLKRMLHG